jgi:hypothetical protein
MYIPLPPVSEIVELRVRQGSFQKHATALRGAKTVVDTTQPPLCPRLIVWHRRLARERFLHKQLDDEKMKLVRDIEFEREQTRVAWGPRPSTAALLDQDLIAELPLSQRRRRAGVETSDAPAGPPQAPRKYFTEKRSSNTLRPSTAFPPSLGPVPSRTGTRRKVVVDDGMTVVDDQPQAAVMRRPSTTGHPPARVSRTRLEPLEPLDGQQYAPGLEDEADAPPQSTARDESNLQEELSIAFTGRQESYADNGPGEEEDDDDFADSHPIHTVLQEPEPPKEPESEPEEPPEVEPATERT